MKNIVIFASGNGSNAANICEYFKHQASARVSALFCNNPAAGVIDKMKAYNVPVVLFSRAEFNQADHFLPLINQHSPSLIVLAGFLLLVPVYLVKEYPQRIINIHPALLPAYGGKGMYGRHVHEAVLAAKQSQHGVTIHYVNDQFDEGEIIFQKSFSVESADDVQTISRKIATLEMKYFPEVIEKLLLQETVK